MLKTSMAVLLAASSAANAVDAPLRIRSIEAHLYLQHSGSLSPPIQSETALWNTIIGEGDSGEPSNSMLIDVILEGRPGSFDARPEVSLVVSNLTSGKTKVRLTSHVGVLSKAGVFHAAFWLNDTGCEPLKFVATIGHDTARKDVPFACGE